MSNVTPIPRRPTEGPPPPPFRRCDAAEHVGRVVRPTRDASAGDRSVPWATFAAFQEVYEAARSSLTTAEDMTRLVHEITEDARAGWCDLDRGRRQREGPPGAGRTGGGPRTARDGGPASGGGEPSGGGLDGDGRPDPVARRGRRASSTRGRVRRARGGRLRAGQRRVGVPSRALHRGIRRGSGSGPAQHATCGRTPWGRVGTHRRARAPGRPGSARSPRHRGPCRRRPVGYGSGLPRCLPDVQRLLVSGARTCLASVAPPHSVRRTRARSMPTTRCSSDPACSTSTGRAETCSGAPTRSWPPVLGLRSPTAVRLRL